MDKINGPTLFQRLKGIGRSGEDDFVSSHIMKNDTLVDKRVKTDIYKIMYQYRKADLSNTNIQLDIALKISNAYRESSTANREIRLDDYLRVWQDVLKQPIFDEDLEEKDFHKLESYIGAALVKVDLAKEDRTEANAKAHEQYSDRNKTNKTGNDVDKDDVKSSVDIGETKQEEPKIDPGTQDPQSSLPTEPEPEPSKSQVDELSSGMQPLVKDDEEFLLSTGNEVQELKLPGSDPLPNVTGTPPPIERDISGRQDMPGEEDMQDVEEMADEVKPEKETELTSQRRISLSQDTTFVEPKSTERQGEVPEVSSPSRETSWISTAPSKESVAPSTAQSSSSANLSEKESKEVVSRYSKIATEIRDILKEFNILRYPDEDGEAASQLQRHYKDTLEKNIAIKPELYKILYAESLKRFAKSKKYHKRLDLNLLGRRMEKSVGDIYLTALKAKKSKLEHDISHITPKLTKSYGLLSKKQGAFTAIKHNFHGKNIELWKKELEKVDSEIKKLEQIQKMEKQKMQNDPDLADISFGSQDFEVEDSISDTDDLSPENTKYTEILDSTLFGPPPQLMENESTENIEKITIGSVPNDTIKSVDVEEMQHWDESRKLQEEVLDKINAKVLQLEMQERKEGQDFW